MTKRLANPTLKRSHHATRCPADRIATRKADPAAVSPTWHVHTGHLKLIIIGPGKDQWFPVSKPAYKGIPGTPTERAIAALAVATLNSKHAEDEDLDRDALNPILHAAAISHALARSAAKRAAKA
jgi:hypothetical protein